MTVRLEGMDRLDNEIAELRRQLTAKVQEREAIHPLLKEDNTGDFWASNSEEHYAVGPEDSIEGVVEEFKSEHDGDEPKFIGKGTAIYCEVDGESLVEDLANGSLYEELYEDALSDWCNKKDKAAWENLSSRLTRVLHDWLDEQGENKCWTVIHSVPNPLKGTAEVN